MRKKIIDNVKLKPKIRFDGNGFICVLINSRCPVGCKHCMFFSNMSEGRNSTNTMTESRLSSLMKLVRDSNTGYFLVSGGGEGFLEPELMYRIIEETNADITWMVTGAHWARDKESAREIVRKMYDAFQRGKHKEYGRKIYVRVSLDTHHVEKIALPNQNPLQYVIDLIRIFETEYANEDGFLLMFHSLEGEEALVDDLCKAISGEKLTRYDPLHDKVKLTEYAFTVKLESGYEFEVTFAKLLLSDLAANLRDKETLKKRIEVFEEDAFRNEQGKPAVKYNADGRIGPNMLVVYNGRVAGGWQSEMPDVPINLDFDDFQSIMQKTLSDPGVLGTIENGLAYRFGIIQEVCPKAVIRSKAVNIRDYSSLVLLEEDKIKLYYSIRVLQDFIAQSRIEENEIESWPSEVRHLVSMTKDELQALYRDAGYDIVQQFVESDHLFDEFIRCVKQYIRERDPETILNFFESNPVISERTVDKWRLLLERIVNGWYDLYTFSEEEIGAIEEVERILDKWILAGKRVYEGLSFP
ncbi:MAG: 4Fe-4S cluster-binding domain-containing protein [Candidatus Bathyarchaeota archaeon]